MKVSLKKGFSFGLTSGIITTLGLIIGLDASSGSKAVVIGGIMIIAITDALSDALGVHVSEEAENKHSVREIWESTLATFGAKFIFALTFLVPVLIFPLNLAVIICVIWGLSLIVGFSAYIAKQDHAKAWMVIGEHLLITVVVIIATYYIGSWINKTFV
ncbi:MAG: hypothetical protein WC752_01470 [Patescibacteria group bacterium]|jgi:VIT1/CCC1 family predicted Fe2+/Mn2+ transporter